VSSADRDAGPVTTEPLQSAIATRSRTQNSTEAAISPMREWPATFPATFRYNAMKLSCFAAMSSVPVVTSVASS
jgi:hypothetical protein